MRRKALIVAAGVLISFVLFGMDSPAAAENPPDVASACDEAGAESTWFRALFGRRPDPDGLAYWLGRPLAGPVADEDLPGRRAGIGGPANWLGLVAESGRDRVTSWIAQSDELARVLPYRRPSMCDKIAQFGLSEVRPGIAVGRTGSTVTVIADRATVDYRAADGGRTSPGRIPGDVVVNANWFTSAGSQGPVVVDGVLSGSADTTERGQILARSEGCDGPATHGHLRHVWTGEIYRHDSCVVTAVSGVSLVHKGLRADAYPGFDITNGYTNTSRSHSFIGFNGTEIIIIATTEMNASALADYAISLGVDEGIMLDGGGSTQIHTPTVTLTSSRPVPAFAVLASRP